MISTLGLRPLDTGEIPVMTIKKVSRHCTCPGGTEAPPVLISAVRVLSGLTSEPQHDLEHKEGLHEAPPAPFRGSQTREGDWPGFSPYLRSPGKEKNVWDREVLPGACLGNPGRWDRVFSVPKEDAGSGGG